MDSTVFLGDVVCIDDVEINVTAAGTDVTNFTLAAGSWFSSALAMWQYLIAEHNSDHTRTTQVRLNSDGSIRVAWGVGVTYTVEIVSGTGIQAALGMASATESGTKQYDTEILPSYFAPEFPLVKYEKSVKSYGAETTTSADGTLCSYGGVSYKLRDMEIALDYRDGSYTERQAWEYLWENYWLLGRSVAVYLDSDSIPDGEPASSALTGDCENLVLYTDPQKLAFERVIEYSDNTILTTDGTKFAVMSIFPLSGPQNLLWVVE